MNVKSTATSSSLELDAPRLPGKLGDMLAQRKIDEARRLTSEHRLLIALELSDAAAVFHRAGFQEALAETPRAQGFCDTHIFHSFLLSFTIRVRFSSYSPSLISS